MFNGLFSFTSTGPFTAMHWHEWFAQCPPQARTPPSPAATTAGERDGPVARPTIAIVDGVRIRPIWHIWRAVTPSTLDSRSSFFLGQLFSPPCIQASSVFLVGALPNHFVNPSLLLLRHGVVAPQSFLALFFLIGLVLSGGLETVYSVIVSLAITGPHLFDTVHGRILSLPIPPLACPILGGFRFFFFPCVSMVKFDPPCRAHVRQRS